MEDGTIRGVIKRVTCAIVGTEIRLRRALGRARGKTRYELTGTCRRSALCCETPAIQADLLTWYLPGLRRLFLWWQNRINGLELIRADRPTRTFVFRCSHFNWDTRLCDSYSTRPFMCRDYPRGLLSDAWPAFFPQCGHGARERGAERKREAIERADLSPEKKAELLRRLHLE
jgi:Fe-S-cluster containining protein